MALNEVQVKFLNETARPFLETMVRILDDLDTFIADYDAIQAGSDALPTDATVLDDNVTGTGPRSDAPTWTGSNVAALRTYSASMRAVVNTAAEQVLVQKCVRPLAQIRKSV